LLAGAAIFGALIGKAHAVAAYEFGGGFQSGTGHGMTSILVDLDTRRFAARRSDTVAPKDASKIAVPAPTLHTGLALPQGARGCPHLEGIHSTSSKFCLFCAVNGRLRRLSGRTARSEFSPNLMARRQTHYLRTSFALHAGAPL
jgi:hypothetical protein